MNDRKKIIVALAFIVVIVTFPLWSNLGKTVSVPVPELTEKIKVAEQCVMPAGIMASEHMQVLDLWRHSVVRNAERIFIGYDGTEHEMSLSNTCLNCHYNKAGFCDRCHDYASVEPYCWDCHIDNPKGDEE